MNAILRAIAASACLAPSALAGSVYAFESVNANGRRSTAEGVAQLSMEVAEISGRVAGFRFANTGPGAFSISQIHWDNRSGLLAGVESILGSQGVQFTEGLSSRGLPGGVAAGFVTSFGVEARSPAAHHGASAGEWVEVRIRLDEGVSFFSVLEALDSSALRVGVRAVGFAGGRGESFVSSPSLTFAVAPLPSAAAMGAACLSAMAWSRRRRHSA